MRPVIPRLLLLLAALTLAAPAAAQPSRDIAETDAALADTFTLQGVTATQPRRADGGYDWDWRGPRDDPEWAWFFNRHYALETACRAWRQTGDERYLDWILATLDDWVVTHPAPGRMSFSAAWRPLEAARRILGPWTVLHENLRDHAAFTPERRERFLASAHAHGRQLRRHHARSGNHLITEMLALAQLCLVFPGTKDTDEWLAYALGRLEHEYHAQVYPDGAYKELSTHYQRVVALNYQHLLDLLEQHGNPEDILRWRPYVKRLWAYLRAVQKPDGSNPVNNDSDRENIAALLRAHAPRQASVPIETIALPHAGQIVFRSGDPARPQWAFFDRGPHGTAHQHRDRLHFSLTLGLRDFLVDNGRYTYAPGPWRDYFAGPAGHNVLLLDGRGSEPGPDAINAIDPPTRLVLREHWETAYGDARFTTPGNPRAADWRRIVINLRGDGWIVLDRVIAFTPQNLETLWHWHPACEVRTTDADRLVVRHAEETLTVAFATGSRASLTQIRGAEHPAVQGWHSERFNQRAPATCTIARQRLDGPVFNAWFFTPGGVAATIRIDTTDARRPTLILTRGDQTSELSIDLDDL